MEKIRVNRLFVIFFITLVSIMGVSTVIPALPQIQKFYDLDSETVGLVLTVFTLPGIILAPIMGMLSDKYGRRAVLVPSLIIFGLAGVACAFAEDVRVLFVLRFIQGIGVGSLNVLTNTLITDSYQGVNRMRILGYNAMMLGIGTGLMPFVGGILAYFDWRYVFIMSSVSLIAAFLSCFIEYPKVTLHVSFKEYIRSAGKVLSSKRMVLLLSLALGAFLIVYGPLSTYYPLYASEKFGLSSFEIGLLYSCTALGTILVTMKLGYLSQFFTNLVLIRVAHLLYIASMLLFLYTFSPWFFIFPILVYGFAQGLKYPNLVNLVSNEANDENRGIVLAVQGTVFRLSQTIAPVIFGVVYSFFKFDGVFYMGIVLSLIMLSITFFIEDKKI
ncbi:MAG: MFS transporter [Desulfovibrionaceae bacterium]